MRPRRVLLVHLLFRAASLGPEVEPDAVTRPDALRERHLAAYERMGGRVGAETKRGRLQARGKLRERPARRFQA